MRKRFYIPLIILISWLTIFGSVTWAAQSPADLIIFNGPIHTVNTKSPMAEMVANIGDAIALYGNHSRHG